MKKFFYLAIVAFAVMACEPSIEGMSGEDAHVMTTTGKTLIKAMGKPKAEARKIFKDAGFVRLDFGAGYAPKRLSNATADSDDMDIYVYCVDKDLPNVEPGLVVNALEEQNKTYITYTATYLNGKLFNLGGNLFICIDVDDVNGLYLYFSEGFNKEIKGGVYNMWQGTVWKDDEVPGTDPGTDYYNFNAFYDAVYPLNTVYTQDFGMGIINPYAGTSFTYAIKYANEDEYATRWKVNNNGAKIPIATAGFSLTYSAGMYGGE